MFWDKNRLSNFSLRKMMNWLPFTDEKDLGHESHSPAGRTIVADKPGGRGHFIDCFNCTFALMMWKRDWELDVALKWNLWYWLCYNSIFKKFPLCEPRIKLLNVEIDFSCLSVFGCIFVTCLSGVYIPTQSSSLVLKFSQIFYLVLKMVHFFSVEKRS